MYMYMHVYTYVTYSFILSMHIMDADDRAEEVLLAEQVEHL